MMNSLRDWTQHCKISMMDMTFGERLRLLREERELNQTELGAAVGMTQRRISYLENDKYEPSDEDIKALCFFFHVTSDYLLGLSDKKPKNCR